jgi:hypothetical protein
VLYACDNEWWAKYHENSAKTFHGERWTQSRVAAGKYRVRHIEGRNRPGLSRDPEVIHTGGNSGYQVMNLAYHFGARRMILLGYDMQRTGGKSHWHGAHPGGLEKASPYNSWVKRFDVLARDLASEGVEVINCSTHTALTCFRRAKLEDVL